MCGMLKKKTGEERCNRDENGGGWMGKWQNCRNKCNFGVMFFSLSFYPLLSPLSLHASFPVAATKRALNNERSCIIGPHLEVKICTVGAVINRLQYPGDYCHLEGAAGRQSQPMPIRWMSWESVLLVNWSISCSLLFFFTFFCCCQSTIHETL